MTDAVPHTALEWRLPSGVTLTSVLGRPADAPDMKPRAARAVCRPFVPYGADAWRLVGEAAWRPLAELPAAWGLRRLTAADVEALPTGEEEEEGEVMPRRRRRQ